MRPPSGPAVRAYCSVAVEVASDLARHPARDRHAPQGDADVALVGAAPDAGVPGMRAGEGGGQLGGLAVGEPRGRAVVVVARGRLGAVDAVAELHHVEVDLQDAPLGEAALELVGEDR